MKGKRIHQLGIIIFLILITLFNITLNFHLINSTSTDLSTFNGYGNKKSLWNSEKSTNYTPDFTGTGEKCNITLQQSLADTSIISISNASDPLNHTFYEPCPTIQNFPSSLVNIMIEDIHAPNKTIVVEDDLTGALGFHLLKENFISFKLIGAGYIENISICIRESDLLLSTFIQLRLFNSEYDVAKSGVRPKDQLATIVYKSEINGTSYNWWNFTGLHQFFNCSKTYNNTFFLYADKHTDSDVGANIYWNGAYDNSDPDSLDESIVLNSTEDIFLKDGFDPIDLSLKVGVTPFIPNQTLIVEDSAANHRENPTTSRPCATSFQVTGNMYLENVSARLWTNNPGIDNEVKFVLYNSTWDSSNSTSIPGGHYLNDYIDLGNINYTANGWVTITGLHEYLDNSKTDNNTWFIGIWDIDEGTADANWYYTITGVGDTIDETRSYKYHTFYGYWEPVRYPDPPWEDYEVDFWLKLDLRPLNNIPNPENINLKINNSAVMGYPNEYGSGYWSSTAEYSSPSGNLGFTVSADWWDVSCTITVVHIDYTKTDLKATSKFRLVGSGQDVLWNVTESEGLNYFDPRVNEYAAINFTIPASWNNINVFNGTINRTDDVSIRSLNGYNEIHLSSAGNGYWFLTAQSRNLIESIDSYVGANPTNLVNYSTIVHFNVTFKERIMQNDGLINLSIYSPAAISDRLNYTTVKSTFDSNLEFSLGDWDVSDNVTQYGVFRVQVSWQNETAVGFREESLTIIGESKLTLIEPPQDTIFDSDELFSIIVYYEDAHLANAIDDAVINFNIANQGWQSTTGNNGTVGYYAITVHCSEITSSGSQRVEITATSEFFTTQTLEYNFEIVESTTTTSTTQTETSISTTTTTTTTSPSFGLVMFLIAIAAIFLVRRFRTKN
ncbi:MAG: hypothetical protein ACFFCZ_06730 [Promethearchaeota archaeon]